MKQYEAVISTLEKLGGQATLAELYKMVLELKSCKWGTKTPFASIRRIVQTRPEIFRVYPGLWALRSHKSRLGLVEHDATMKQSPESLQRGHSYYQGLLVSIGNRRGYSTFVPNQDKNKLFVNRPLREIRSLQSIPSFSYDYFVKKCGTVDVVWFNKRQMPNRLFEVEHSTDIQNSLLKFCELHDFHAAMIIVADNHRYAEFKYKIQQKVFAEVRARINFLSYHTLVKQYEHEMFMAGQRYSL